MSFRSKKLLRIYLQDHDALLLISQRIARRSAQSNRGTEVGSMLTRLYEEFREDSRALEEILTLLDIRPSRLKRAGTWGAERLGRMKLNGRLLRYSPLSRVHETQALMALIWMKRSMWRALKGSFGTSALTSVDLDGLIERAERQADGLDTHAENAADSALRSD